MSIKSLKLKNFRSYKDEFIEFGPGVNCVIGENDSGKSNLLRAINLVVNNRPSGDDFRSNWGGDTVIELNIGGKTVTRFRSDKENLYLLEDIKEPFKAFGRGVPETIQQHLNMNAVNIAFQLDGPFLLGLSDSDVAKHYNKIVNLDGVDRAISNIASVLRKEKNDLKTEKETEKKKKEELQEYDWIEEADQKAIKLEALSNNINRIKNSWSTLYTLIKEHKELLTITDSLNDITKHDKKVELLLDQSENIDKIISDIAALNNYIESLADLKEKQDKYQNIISYDNQVQKLIFFNIQVEEETNNYNLLCGLVEDYTNLLEREERYNDVIKYENTVNELIKLDDEIRIKANEYDKLYALIKNYKKYNEQFLIQKNNISNLENEFKKLMPEVCPLCDQETKT